MKEFMQRLSSRKFLLALAAVLYIGAQLAGGALTEPAAVDAIYKIVIAYIGTEGAADIVTRMTAPADTTPA